MKRSQFIHIESFMSQFMKDSAHDIEHIYRVLYLALDIAKYEKDVNMDILISACLLHDIGRQKQFENPKLCHAKVGSEMAYAFCIENGYSQKDAAHIKECIASHRFRANQPPQSIEAKILFDADKIDVCGSVGIARTLFYNANIGEPLYFIDDNRNILDGTNDDHQSFLHEYNYKLKHLYDKFYTKRAKQIAKERQAHAIAFYENILSEVIPTYENGKKLVAEILEDTHE